MKIPMDGACRSSQGNLCCCFTLPRVKVSSVVKCSLMDIKSESLLFLMVEEVFRVSSLVFFCFNSRPLPLTLAPCTAAKSRDSGCPPQALAGGCGVPRRSEPGQLLRHPPPRRSFAPHGCVSRTGCPKTGRSTSVRSPECGEQPCPRGEGLNMTAASGREHGGQGASRAPQP